MACCFGSGPTQIVAKHAPIVSKDELCPFDLPNTTYWTCDGKGEGVLQYAFDGQASREVNPPISTHEAFQKAVKKFGKMPMLFQEPPEKVPLTTNKRKSSKTPSKPVIPPSLPMSEWRKWTVAQYYAESKKVSKSLMKSGLVQHDTVSIFGFNSPEWFFAAWGAQFVGAKACGIYPTDTVDQVRFKLIHSDSSFIFVEGRKEMAIIEEIVDDVPYLKGIVCWSLKDNDEGDIFRRQDGTVLHVMRWAEFIELSAKDDDSMFDKRQLEIRPSHCAALVYTSGTTGNPKAVMLSHDNIIFECAGIIKGGLKDMFNDPKKPERALSYLPLSHVAGMMLDVFTPIIASSITKSRAEIYFARSYDLKEGSLANRIRTVRPTTFLGVPRVWEKIADKIKEIGLSRGYLAKSLASFSKRKMLEYQKNCQVGGSARKPMNFGFANSFTGKIRAAIGLDQCKFAFTGAAPLSLETQIFFASLGLNINEVYGMSECSGATTWSTNECHEWGMVGFPILGHEVKIFKIDSNGKKTECPTVKDMDFPTEDEQGEICFRGRHIMMGYLANPKLGEDHVDEIKKKNKEAIDAQGWLHSGDKGCVNKSGMIKITGRFKELIIGSGGENIAPVPVENEIKRLCPAISNCIMIGDKRKFNTVLITLKTLGATGETPGTDDLTPMAIRECGPGIKTVSAALSDPVLIQNISKVIHTVNENGAVVPSSAAKVQKFTILPCDFSMQGGELTPSLKIKRNIVDEKYKNVLEELYNSKDMYMKFRGTLNAVADSAPTSSRHLLKEKSTKAKSSAIMTEVSITPAAMSEGSKNAGYDFDPIATNPELSLSAATAIAVAEIENVQVEIVNQDTPLIQATVEVVVSDADDHNNN